MSDLIMSYVSTNFERCLPYWNVTWT
jgi:hypothetical protein